MAGDTQVTVIGNLVEDPVLRFTQDGLAVTNFTIASTPRIFSKKSNSWEDGETLWMRCTLWRQAAENVAESLTKGTAIIAQGRLISKSWETPEGEKRTQFVLLVEDIGPSLKWATAKVTRASRDKPAPQIDPWASEGGNSPDDPPF